MVPVSGRSSEEVLATASEEEQALVSEWIKFLALSPPEERAALIKREIQSRPLSEVDVWLPEKFTDELRTKSLEEPALSVEAWLEWAEALGRKDALLLAAGLGLERSALRAESGSLLEIASRWAGLPSPDNATRGKASVLSQYAGRLFAAGENDKALDAYKRARKLFEDAGDRRGQGETFNGEANVLSQSGDNEKALDAYRQAHKLYEAAGYRLGEGLAFYGEANALYFMSDYDQSLAAYKRAREIFDHLGYRRGQGSILVDEAYVEILLEQPEKALTAYERARKIFEEVGSRQEEGDTWVGEGEILFQLGESEKALDAYNVPTCFSSSSGTGGDRETRSVMRRTPWRRRARPRRLSTRTDAPASSSSRSSFHWGWEMLSWERRGSGDAKRTGTRQRASPRKRPPPTARRAP